MYMNNNLYYLDFNSFDSSKLFDMFSSLSNKYPYDQTVIRELISAYYDMENISEKYKNRSKTISKLDSPNDLLKLYREQIRNNKYSLAYIFKNYANNFISGKWTLSQYGIKPVHAATLLAYVDVTKSPTVNSLWRYSGLDPNYNKNNNWNNELKFMSNKLGEIFQSLQDNTQSIYGQLYSVDLERRISKNDLKEYAEKAEQILQSKHVDKNSTEYECLTEGYLSINHIEAQAKRFAVKIFLSHYHAIAYQENYGVKPVRSDNLQTPNGSTRIDIPNNPFQ